MIELISFAFSKIPIEKILHYLLFSIPILWLIKEIKSTLFWIYLWQLKEYHLGRFIDHFRTVQGKKIFFNLQFIFKIFLYFSFFYFSKHFLIFSILLFFVYIFESLNFLRKILKKKLLYPKFTLKSTFLVLVSLFCFFIIFKAFFSNIQTLLLYDIFDFAVICGLVFTFQPLTSILRKRSLNLATKKRKEFKNLIVIGITGSFGKTSTKEFLATILEYKYGRDRVLKTPAHFNSEIGISKVILDNLNITHLFFVCEMGAYNKGGIKKLAKIVQPKIGIVTGVNEQHLALFGSFENLLSAEGGKELLEALPKDGLLIYNGDNEILQNLYSQINFEKRTVGIKNSQVDLQAFNIKVQKDSLSFFVVSKKEGEVIEITTNLIGAQNIPNLLLAICCAQELGIEIAESAVALRYLKPEQGGVTLVKTPKYFNVVDASYSTNPDAVLAHLDYLKIWQGKKVILMPSLIELGKKAKEVHQKIGKKIYEVCDLAIITTKDYFKEIKKEGKEKVFYTSDPKKVYDLIRLFRGEEDVILIEGRVKDEIKQVLWK